MELLYLLVRVWGLGCLKKELSHSIRTNDHGYDRALTWDKWVARELKNPHLHVCIHLRGHFCSSCRKLNRNPTVLRYQGRGSQQHIFQNI